MTAQDVYKFLYQSAFGCAHLAPAKQEAQAELQAEYARLKPAETAVEPLDGPFARVPLGLLREGLDAGTLAGLFCASAEAAPVDKAAFRALLAAALRQAKQGALPFPAGALSEAFQSLAAQGFPAVRHSAVYRTAYRPAYRVIAQRFLPFLPLLARIDTLLKNGPVLVAVDGGSASGKTELGAMLCALYGCTVLHMDDFFLRPQQRTPERYAEPGGNVDRERFLEEVLRPLKARKPIAYRRFSCQTMTLQPAQTLLPDRLTVVEGTYALHPDLAGYYDLSVFLEIDPQLQRERLSRRETPESLHRFMSVWIPLEQAYFDALCVPQRCDLRIRAADVR